MLIVRDINLFDSVLTNLDVNLFDSVLTNLDINLFDNHVDRSEHQPF
jgi:hypothetical protein